MAEVVKIKYGFDLPPEHFYGLNMIITKKMHWPGTNIRFYSDEMDCRATTEIVGMTKILDSLADELNEYVYDYDLYDEVVIEII